LLGAFLTGGTPTHHLHPDVQFATPAGRAGFWLGVFRRFEVEAGAPGLASALVELITAAVKHSLGSVEFLQLAGDWVRGLAQRDHLILPRSVHGRNEYGPARSGS
jgi:hypothetical protein